VYGSSKPISIPNPNSNHKRTIIVGRWNPIWDENLVQFIRLRFLLVSKEKRPTGRVNWFWEKSTLGSSHSQLNGLGFYLGWTDFGRIIDFGMTWFWVEEIWVHDEYVKLRFWGEELILGWSYEFVKGGKPECAYFAGGKHLFTLYFMVNVSVNSFLIKQHISTRP
jgi:hypothetical protein